MPSSTELDALAAHVHYEVTAMAELPLHIAYHSVFGPSTVKNACLESLLLHARAVIEFVYGRPTIVGGQPTGARRRSAKDVQPIEFVAGWVDLDDSDRLDSWLDLIDKHLSHLSRARGTVEESLSWNAYDLVTQVGQAFARFVATVPESSPYKTLLTNAVRQAETAAGRSILAVDWGSVTVVTEER